MTALSIRHMNFTLRLIEQENERRDAEQYAQMTAEEKAEPLHYWHLERKVVKATKRGSKVEWKFARHLYMTKSDVARFWERYRGSKEFRLRHWMVYGQQASKLEIQHA
jgi:hypothetical protein